MAKIKVLKDSQLIGGSDNTAIYPITHAEAVYDSSNKKLSIILNELDAQDTKAATDIALAEAHITQLAGKVNKHEERLDDVDIQESYISTQLALTKNDVAKLSATIAEKTSINPNDKVLTSSEGLMANISINYNSSTKKISLIGKDNIVISQIDATDFIKDGIVSSAEVVVNPQGHPSGTYIKITFSSDYPIDPIYINVTSLIDVYTSGNGININSSNEVSIKLDTSSESFISTSANGLKLSGIQTKIDAVNNRVDGITLATLPDVQMTTNAEIDNMIAELIPMITEISE